MVIALFLEHGLHSKFLVGSCWGRGVVGRSESLPQSFRSWLFSAQNLYAIMASLGVACHWPLRCQALHWSLPFQLCFNIYAFQFISKSQLPTVCAPVQRDKTVFLWKGLGKSLSSVSLFCLSSLVPSNLNFLPLYHPRTLKQISKVM